MVAMSSNVSYPAGGSHPLQSSPHAWRMMNARSGFGFRAAGFAVATVIVALGTAAAQKSTVPVGSPGRVMMQMRAAGDTREACEALRDLRLDDTTIEAAGMI